MADRPNIRIYVEDDLGEGAALGLSAPQAHYLKHVMRQQAGAEIALFNGRDGEWRGRIDGFGKGWCSVTVGDRTSPQSPEPDLWLVFAPIKRARIDFIAQKATELGVSAICPVFTQHTAVDRVNSDRLRANAVEAAEQCDRLTVPDIHEPRRLDRALEDWPADRQLMFCDERGAPVPTEALAGAKPGPWAVLVGPEGGFSDKEATMLKGLEFTVSVGLGRRLLRADTAAIAALSLWQATLGDWRA